MLVSIKIRKQKYNISETNQKLNLPTLLVKKTTFANIEATIYFLNNSAEQK